jgi:hypothetical protein
MLDELGVVEDEVIDATMLDELAKIDEEAILLSIVDELGAVEDEAIGFSKLDELELIEDEISSKVEGSSRRVTALAMVAPIASTLNVFIIPRF